MTKLTLFIDAPAYKGLDEYLKHLDGIEKVTINNKEFTMITIYYDETKITIKMLKLEILLYLELTKIPSIIGFDKHGKATQEYHTSINDFCCEYCLKIMVESLLDNQKINSVVTDYCDDIYTTNKLNMTITYNPDITNSKEILKLINDSLNN